jgi:hypothetical protein
MSAYPTAPALLAELARRGVILQSDGERLRYDAPRGAVADLLPDLARFKPALLELAAPKSSSAPAAPEAPATEPATAPPFRRANEFVFVPAKVEPAPGAAAICGALQTFRSLFAAARGGDLPTQPLELDGEAVKVENAAAAVCEIFAAWTKTARECQRDRRDLTTPEQSALDEATQFLDGIAARWNGAAWLDLNKIGAQLDGDFAQMLQKQRATKKPSEATE